jgi:hypothetical protein
MAVPDRVVFDAEALIVHADDERGSDVVEEYLDAVAASDAVGYACCVIDPRLKSWACPWTPGLPP